MRETTIKIQTDHDLGQSNIIYQELETDYAKTLLPHISPLTYFGGSYEKHDVSRSQRWYQNDGHYFNPEWPHFERWIAQPYTETLNELQTTIGKHVAKLLESSWVPNSLLINKYETGNNIISRHRDSEHIFGENPTIAVLSIGAPRTLRFTPINPDSNSFKAISTDIIDIKLASNSLLVMSGTTQKYYCHELLRDESITDTRFSLTFRTHLC